MNRVKCQGCHTLLEVFDRFDLNQRIKRLSCAACIGHRRSWGSAVKLTTDMIYEAALDDDLFAELPNIIAGAVDARSCVLHWRGESGASEIFTHSGYFSDEQMADYATNFADHDVWTDAGMRQGFANRAWNTSDLVATSEFESSIFYNEWIRQMGDDTFYCCGSVMQTVDGHGIIGLHRGRTQADFSPEVLRRLNSQVGHLRRMFAIRGRIGALQQRHDLLGAVFSAGPDAAVVLSREGRVLMANTAGDAFLRAGRFLRTRKGHLRCALTEDEETFRYALSAAFDREHRRASNCLLRAVDGGVVVLSAMPLAAHSSQPMALIMIDVPRKRMPRDIVARHLQSAYGLSGAEAEIALQLADGKTVQDISDSRQSALGTVRTQVKHILSKMDAKRQADVVRTVVAAYHLT